MASAVAEDCESDRDKCEDIRSVNTAEAGNTSAAHSPAPLAGCNNEEEEDYEQAALAAAEDLFNELQEAPPDESGATIEGSGGFFVENPPPGDESNGEDDVASDEQKEVCPDFIRLHGRGKPNGECITHAEYLITGQSSAGVPNDSELAELLDDGSTEPTTFNSSAGQSESPGRGNLNQSTIQAERAIGSSLLDGSAGLAARRRAAEAASWCSQHQAADLYCLREQLLKEEAAAGRLRVRQHPNPHGEAFKPMRLYAIKEVEALAVRVWGSLEAAKAAKERRIEERWQRKKRGVTLHRPASPLHAKKQQTSETPSEQRAVAAPPPIIPRTKEDEWEEI
ncbi:hypothetical protein ACSSS7_007598 [Eimeria intestinalis]